MLQESGLSEKSLTKGDLKKMQSATKSHLPPPYPPPLPLWTPLSWFSLTGNSPMPVASRQLPTFIRHHSSRNALGSDNRKGWERWWEKPCLLQSCFSLMNERNWVGRDGKHSHGCMQTAQKSSEVNSLLIRKYRFGYYYPHMMPILLASWGSITSIFIVITSLTLIWKILQKDAGLDCPKKKKNQTNQKPSKNTSFTS